MERTFIAALVLGLSLFSVSSQGAVELKFGVYTSDKPTTMVKKFRPVLKSLEESMGKELGEAVTLKIQVSKTYEEGVDAIANGDVDFSRLGAASYISAKTKNPALKVLAMEAKKGMKEFMGVICVRNDSPIQSVEELKGKRFAFGNERSTIGRYLSQRYLNERGINAADLAHFEYLGRHDIVGTAVAAGQFDAGALKEGTFKKLIKKGAPLRQIATFTNVTKPWISHDKVPAKVQKALRQALLNLKDERALKALKKDGFVEGDDSDFETIRVAIEENAKFFQ